MLGPVERPQPGNEMERVWMVEERWVRWVMMGVKVLVEPPQKCRNMRVGVVGEGVPVVRGRSVEDILW